MNLGYIIVLSSLITIYVASNDSEYFEGDFSISIVSMLGFNSFDDEVNITNFNSGSKNFQIPTKDMNKAAKIPCILATLSTLFISSIEDQGYLMMVRANNVTTPLIMAY